MIQELGQRSIKLLDDQGKLWTKPRSGRDREETTHYVRSRFKQTPLSCKARVKNKSSIRKLGFFQKDRIFFGLKYWEE